MVRGLEVPGVVPALELTAPSGEVWTWNAEENANRISGSAVEFAQVVTQVRNIADTSLEVTGPIATEWMSMAQCFAGGPETPPAPVHGTRPGSRRSLGSSRTTSSPKGDASQRCRPGRRWTTPSTDVHQGTAGGQ